MFRSVHKGPSDGRLMVSGKAPLASLNLQTVRSSLSLTDAQSGEIESTVERMRARGLRLTDDPIYRLESWDLESGFQLNVSLASYFQNIVVKQHPQWNIRSQALAVVAVVECPQGFVIERRSEKVAALPGYLHPSPSGNVEPPSTPLECFYKEAQEELGLQSHEFDEVCCLGLVYGETSGIYQIVANANTQVPFDEICERPCSGQWERAELLFAPKTAEGLSAWLKEQSFPITQGGRTALLMAGSKRWGEAWFEENI